MKDSRCKALACDVNSDKKNTNLEGEVGGENERKRGTGQNEWNPFLWGRGGIGED